MSSIAEEITRLQTAKADIKTALESKGIKVPPSLKIDGYAQLINDYLQKETRVVAKFNVTDTSSPTQLCNDGESMFQFSALEIDGVAQPNVISEYTFSTTGIHTARFTLVDPTSIESEAFNGCSKITSIAIPNGVTSIGNAAFYSCYGLTSITIPNGVTSIGNGAFYYCSNLTSVTIGSSVTSIGSQAFNGCSKITSITIPNSVTSIGARAFENCYNITSITIGNSVTSIGNSAFSGLYNITSITIPNSVTSIGNSAFQYCSRITSVTIGSSVTSIGSSAFSGCYALISITSNATAAPTIASNTFSEVKSGGTLTVPSGSTGYDVWMGTGNYYLGKYNWTKVEQ